MNINDIVYVYLTDRGRLVLYDYEIRQADPQYSKKLEGNCLRLQMWQLMRVFGPAMVMGLDPCFEDNCIHFMAP